MEVHLELCEIRKTYGRIVAVDGLSLSVPRGAIYGLLGPNGAGKTTTIRAIMRITLPDSGRVLLSGQPVDDVTRERIGYLPEERGLYRKMKAAEHLAYLAEVRGLARPEARRRATMWLERLGLAEKAKCRIEELSKGMQQKVQFAGAIIHEPELVIFDEPFSGLDPIGTRQLKDEIVAMRTRGTTVLLSTHVLPQAEELCDALCLINRGRAILDGTLTEVRARFARPSLRVETTGSATALAGLPGVAAVRRLDDGLLVELADDAPSAGVIREVVAALPVTGVAPYRASLEDVFLRAVEEDHAAVA
jgi:ABC-2 type transport system ATP-binding protein